MFSAQVVCMYLVVSYITSKTVYVDRQELIPMYVCMFSEAANSRTVYDKHDHCLVRMCG